jgi:iron complex outermembrane receptor protein
MGSPAVLTSIYSNTQRTDYNSEAEILNGFLRGPLLKLPAGALDAVLGGDYQHSTLSRGFNANRNVKSAFAELRAPIITSEGGGGDKREILAVQTAARYDDYSDFGSKTTWQVGIEFRPAKDLLLRGTHATAFKPPTLYNLAASVLSFPNPVTDPRRNGETLFVQSMFGGNPDLSPTTGTSSTLGIVWSPRQIPGLNLSLTPWWLRTENAINLPSVQYVVDNEALYPNRVVRAPAPPGEVGQITSVDFSYLNFGKIHESGIDANIDWTFETKLGRFTPAIAATYMTEFTGASTGGAQSVSRLSRANSDGIFAPRWKSTASIGWAPYQPFKLWLAGRYIGRYVDFTPPRTIGNVWYFDATLEVDLKRAFRIENSSLGGFRLLVSGTNLANTLPPYSTYSRGYDVYNYDIVGRSIFIRLQLQR